MGCNRKDCFYYGVKTETCDYYLQTGKRRGCHVEQCDKFRKDIPIEEKRLMWAMGGFLKRNGSIKKLSKDKAKKAAELYRIGCFDTEIARSINADPSAVMAWRWSLGLRSNYDRALDFE